MLLALTLACTPAEPSVEDSFDGGQSGGTTATCGEETRTPITDPDEVPEGAPYSAQSAMDGWDSPYVGDMDEGGEPITLAFAFGTDIEWVLLDRCGGWYEIPTVVSFDHPELDASFTGENLASSDRAAVTGSATGAAYTTTLAPETFDPTEFGAVWLALRLWIEGARLYGEVSWKAGAAAPPPATTATTDTSPETTTEGGVTESIGWFEAYAVE